MTSVPIAFFQVGATAIPTLLVAVAVGLKHGAAQAEAFKTGPRWVKVNSVILVLVFIGTAGIGELAALTALFRGAGNVVQAGFVWNGITTSLALIVGEFMTPIADAMKPKAAIMLYGSVAVVWGAAVVYGAYMLAFGG